jgi:hypothetical protein
VRSSCCDVVPSCITDTLLLNVLAVAHMIEKEYDGVLQRLKEADPLFHLKSTQKSVARMLLRSR